MISVEVTNLKQVQEALKDQPKKVNLVLSRAINRATTNARSNMSKRVTQEYTILARDVKKTINVTKATTSNPSATVKSKGQRLDLIDFKLNGVVGAGGLATTMPSSYQMNIAFISFNGGTNSDNSGTGSGSGAAASILGAGNNRTAGLGNNFLPSGGAGLVQQSSNTNGATANAPGGGGNGANNTYTPSAGAPGEVILMW